MGKVLLILDVILDEKGLSLLVSYEERRFSDKFLRRETTFEGKKTPFLVVAQNLFQGESLYGERF